MSFLKVRSKLRGNNSHLSVDKFWNLNKSGIKYKPVFSSKIIKYTGFIINNKLLQLRWDCPVIYQTALIYHFDSETNFYIEDLETCSDSKNLINIIANSYQDLVQNFEHTCCEAKSFPPISKMSPNLLEISLIKLNEVMEDYKKTKYN